MAFPVGLWLACLLDFILGDPRAFPHPVTLIAKTATAFASFFRKHIASERRAGQATAACALFVCATTCAGILFALRALSPLALFSGAVLLLYTTMALRSLADHAMAVSSCLDRAGETGSLVEARKSVGRIVGRDTSELDRAGIIRACVESVAENMSDGVIAPMFFAVSAAVICVIFGRSQYCLPVAATAALLYKAVNTMDSMFGYTNDQYIDFGRTAALMDDRVNFIPARLSALAIVFVSFFTRGNSASAWKIMRRDRRKHASPNGGYPEAAMAGALGLQLGGPNSYFGKIVEKPVIGDDTRPPVKEDISAAVRIITHGFLVCIALFSLFYLLVLVAFGQ